MHYVWISFFALSILLLGASLACFFDHRKKRLLPENPSLSVIIPCFNDADTIRATIQSVYASWESELLEVLLVNDASTDDSARVLEALKQEFPVTVLHNPMNLGKTETLNQAARKARHDILLFVDADTCLNKHAVQDLLARLLHHAKTAAVSCPYQPANRGWLPRIQSIDYSMITVLQGAYNIFSGLALWGGCIAVKKDVFEKLEGFSATAITEDVELAFRLNRAGWRVEQSLVAVKSHAPDTMRSWMKQKIRWTAGGFQCLVLHPSVWLRNPLQVLLIALYSVLSINGFFALIRQTLMLDRMYDRIRPLINVVPIASVLDTIEFLYGSILMNNLLLMACFAILSSIYVIPLISRWRDTSLLLLVVPFSLVYFPLYSLISLTGLCYFLFNAQQINRTQRAW
jgi:poly-beta-1,6-N-acetyl-D-glucosamine synthase